MGRRTALLFLLFFAILLLPGVAFARVGGGGSYGGGGGSGGGGGGGDCAGILIEFVFRFWIQFCIQCPQVGLPVTAVVIVGFVFLHRYHKTDTTLSSSITLTGANGVLGHGPGAEHRLSLDQLRSQDPCFSTPLFLDFVQLLFARYHVQRGKGNLAPLAPYIAKGILDRAAMRKGVESVDDVLIASSRITRVEADETTRISVLFTANYRETAGGRTTQFYTEEAWTFTRDRGVRSKPPEQIARLGCPACGSAEEPRPDGSCAHCGQVVRSGAFHWFVMNIATFEKKPAVVYSPVGGEEVGTDLPTVFSPTFGEQKRAFQARHPEFSWDQFVSLATDAFLKLQKAWSEMQWEKARALETDHLFSVHAYWIEQYRRAGLVNRVEEVQVERVLPCKIETDAFYEAITARISASCLDCTVDRNGKVVEGSKSGRRRFSEYWTFIRRIGCDKQATPITGGCPSCGAELKIGMAGVCEYCHSKVTSGAFGWVLTSIDQDEEYHG